LRGNVYDNAALIRGEADLANTPYYTQKLYPLIFDGVDAQILTVSKNLNY
jgi:hypothetical protein